jgi:hypothetical protein
MSEIRQPTRDLYVSLILPCHGGDEAAVAASLAEYHATLTAAYSHFEIIVVSDTVDDRAASPLRQALSRLEGLRVIRLAQPGDVDAAVAAGMDTAIGDYVVVQDATVDPAAALAPAVALCEGMGGVVYGVPAARRFRFTPRNLLSKLFASYCRRVLGVDIQRRSSLFRVFSRAAVNSYLQTRGRNRNLRVITTRLGQPTQPFAYSPRPGARASANEGLFSDLNLAFDILASTSEHPLRWVSRAAALIALGNLAYIGYIVAIYLLKDRVAEGWVTLSMQQAAMFTCLFAVLMVVCEYLGKLVLESQQQPYYTVRDEWTSSVLLDPERYRNVVRESAHE